MMRHARINLRTGESYEPPSTKELIEKQIEEAAEHFAAMIEAHKQGRMNSWGKAIEGYCGNLLRIVQNQQSLIEDLIDWRRSNCAHDWMGNNTCGGCGAPWREVKN